MFKFKNLYVIMLSTLSVAAYADPVSYTHKSGATVVEISKPNASGLSHNMYKSFNVSSKGMILNNSTDNITNTSVGQMGNNANLTNGAASVILNEVVSNQSSSLNGFIEVAGQKADVIIANPNGISCSGCSFINAGNTTLTTGESLLNSDGSLAGFRVKNGTITIDNKGLTNKEGYADLLARNIKLNGMVQANSVNAVGGSFDYDYNQKNISSHNATLTLWEVLSPSYSIDIAQLGGIKANQIQLVGNTLGLGVRNEGNILANSTLTISNTGVINNSGTLSAGTSSNDGSVTLQSLYNFENSGKVLSSGKLAILSLDNLVNSGTIYSTSSADLYFMGSEFTNKGSIDASSQLTVASVNQNMGRSQGRINNSGTMNSLYTQLIGGEINQSENSQLNGHTLVNLNGSAINISGKVTGGNIMVQGSTLTNKGNISALNNININTEKLVNTGTIAAANTIALTAPKIENSGNCLLWSCTKGTISANTLKITSPSIKKVGDLSGNVSATVLEINKPQM